MNAAHRPSESAVEADSAGMPSVSRREFGRLPDRRVVDETTLTHGRGLTLSAINHGGIVTAIRCPDWWSMRPALAGDDGSVALELDPVSEDGDQGYPGRLQAHVRYTLTLRNEWRIDYRAKTDRPTVAASRHTTIHPHLIPTGLADVGDVADTAFDFREPTRIAERIRQGTPELTCARGYDHHWILDRRSVNGSGSGGADALMLAARLEDPGSGRVMEIVTTEPGLQFYSGDLLDGSLVGAAGQAYRQGDRLCLETQHFPDSPNRPEFPSTELRPGQWYASTTVHRFSTGVAAQAA